MAFGLGGLVVPVAGGGGGLTLESSNSFSESIATFQPYVWFPYGVGHTSGNGFISGNIAAPENAGLDVPVGGATKYETNSRPVAFSRDTGATGNKLGGLIAGFNGSQGAPDAWVGLTSAAANDYATIFPDGATSFAWIRFTGAGTTNASLLQELNEYYVKIDLIGGIGASGGFRVNTQAGGLANTAVRRSANSEDLPGDGNLHLILISDPGDGSDATIFVDGVAVSTTWSDAGAAADRGVADFSASDAFQAGAADLEWAHHGVFPGAIDADQALAIYNNATGV